MQNAPTANGTFTSVKVRHGSQPQGLLQREAAQARRRLADLVDAVDRRRGDPEPGGATRPMRRALAGLCAALCLGAAAPASSVAARFAAHRDRRRRRRSSTRRTPPRSWRSWKALGIDVARIHVRWVSIAPAPNARRPPRGFDPSNPNDPHYNWGPLDHAIGLLAERRDRADPGGDWLGPAVVVVAARRWATRAGGRRRAASRQFATAVARRYGDVVTDYILWNEPDQAGWLQPQFSCRGDASARPSRRTSTATS